MSVAQLPSIGPLGSDFRNITEEEKDRLIASAKDSKVRGESYAELVKRRGVANIVFRYSTGSFHALNAAGEELAAGETVKDVLTAL